MTATNAASVSKYQHKQQQKSYNLLPRLPPFLRVLSVGIGVTSSARKNKEHVKLNWRIIQSGTRESDDEQSSTSTGRTVHKNQYTYTTNLHARTSQSPKCRLSTRTWSLGLIATSCTKLDMESSKPQLLLIQRIKVKQIIISS